MNQKVGQSDPRNALGLDTGLEALRQSSEFRGPVEPLDVHDHDHGKNDHFASIYEGREEQFATAIPFVRQGLDRGEQCLYVADDNSRDEVLEAMRSRGIDVDAALESGALSVLTKEETYLETGEFDRDAMLEFWEDALEQAKYEDGYAGVRAAAEMTWALDSDTNLDRLVEYEAMLNDLYEDEDYVVLCQYNRERFPAAVVRDVIRTHPHLIQEDEVYHNVYYTPPEEYFGPDRPDREIDRMMGTLRERNEVKTRLKERQRYLREQNEITASPDQSFEEKLQALFDLGCERFDLELGGMACVEPDTDGFVIEHVSDDHEHFEPGMELPLSETYCTTVAETKGLASVSDPLAEGYEDVTVRQEFGIETYLGTYVEVEGGPDRTFFFISSEPRSEPFSDEERSFHRLMGQWVKYELERQQRDRHQRRLYEIAADGDMTFDEKLQALFDLGCERFDLELGGIARIDPETDLFEVETISGEHEYLVPGAQADLSETYCRVFTDDAEVTSITDPMDSGFEDTLAYEEFGVETYLGTRLELDDDLDRTFFFVSSEPRSEEFSDAERTFHHLMGQWVQYELERQQRERELRERTEHLSALVETTPECIKTVAPDGTLLQMNPAGLDMVEADSESDVVGECVYDLIAPEHRERFREFNERICGGERGTLEFDVVGLEGTRRQMETHAAPLHRPDGTTVHVALTRDVTEQVEREQQLEETVEKLEESNERLESFASMLAHELRNPVTIGQIYSQQLPDETDAETVEYVAEAFDRIEDMIDVMLVLTRGREAISECSSVNVAAVTREAWDEVDAPDATLDVAIDDTIQVEETYVRHLFRNLMENAVEHGSTSSQSKADDAGEHGGEDVTVTVGDLPSGFYVADDGVGIPPEERDAVFDAGYTTASDEGGTGLGLAFVRELADVYEWDCEVTESATGGARFEFRNVDGDPSDA